MNHKPWKLIDFVDLDGWIPGRNYSEFFFLFSFPNLNMFYLVEQTFWDSQD